MRRSLALAVLIAASTARAQSSEWTVGNQTYQIVRAIPGYDVNGIYDFAFGKGPRLTLANAGAGRLSPEGLPAINFRWGILSLANGEPLAEKSDGGVRYTMILSYSDSFHVAQGNARKVIAAGTVDEISVVLRPAEQKLILMGTRPRPLAAAELPTPMSSAWGVWERQASRIAASPASGAPTPAAASSATEGSFKDAVQEDLTNALADQAAKGGIDGKNAARAAQTLNTAATIITGIDEMRAAKRNRDSIKKENALRIERALAVRRERLASGVPDVVGFAAPLRPGPTDVVIPVLQAHVEDFGFCMEEPALVKEQNAFMQTGQRFCYDDLAGSTNTPERRSPVSKAFVGLSDWKILKFHVRYILAAKGKVQLKCTFYGPSGTVLASTETAFPPRTPLGSAKNMVSIVALPPGSAFAPGTYGAECASDGVPIINSTIDLVP
jgi:hypothetical protein